MLRLPVGVRDELRTPHQPFSPTLVIDNIAEFSRASGLRVENWLQA
jgi:hypothetical protein